MYVFVSLIIQGNAPFNGYVLTFKNKKKKKKRWQYGIVME